MKNQKTTFRKEVANYLQITIDTLGNEYFLTQLKKGIARKITVVSIFPCIPSVFLLY